MYRSESLYSTEERNLLHLHPYFPPTPTSRKQGKNIDKKPTELRDMLINFILKIHVVPVLLIIN